MFSDTVTITATKAGVGFTGKGETGSSVVNFAPIGSADDENVIYYLFVICSKFSSDCFISLHSGFLVC